VIQFDGPRRALENPTCPLRDRQASSVFSESSTAGNACLLLLEINDSAADKPGIVTLLSTATAPLLSGLGVDPLNVVTAPLEALALPTLLTSDNESTAIDTSPPPLDVLVKPTSCSRPATQRSCLRSVYADHRTIFWLPTHHRYCSTSTLWHPTDYCRRRTPRSRHQHDCQWRTRLRGDRRAVRSLLLAFWQYRRHAEMRWDLSWQDVSLDLQNIAGHNDADLEALL